jgi:hypothetical protein
MVSKWEAADSGVVPRPINQAAFDTSLRLASPEVRARFEQLASGQTLRIEAPSLPPGARLLVCHPVDGKLMTFVEPGTYRPAGADARAFWLPGYYIDVYPTTGVDYGGYLSATDQRPPVEWPDRKKQAVLADTPIQLPWLDAHAYTVWASKSLPTLTQWERAAGGGEGMVVVHLAEWYVAPDGPRRRGPVTGGGTKAGFRCVVSAAEMAELLAI